MHHLTNEYLGEQTAPQGQKFHAYKTVCGMKFGMSQALPRGATINLGSRDGQKCDECHAHLGLNSHLANDAHKHAELGGLHEDISDVRDGGRGITKVSGLGESLIETEEGGWQGGDLGGYSEGFQDELTAGMGQYEDDPYGEGDVAEQKGIAARKQGIPWQNCPYKGGLMRYRWLLGWKKQHQLSRMGGG